jgi:hypothetical protein
VRLYKPDRQPTYFTELREDYRQMKMLKQFTEHVETGDTDPKSRNPGCANFDHHYGGCLFRDECLVQQGQRCRYFERVISQSEATS